MYRCQSALKLLEINDRYRIFHRLRPSTVVDLAAAPGGFAQVALELMHLPENAPQSALPPMSLPSISGPSTLCRALSPFEATSSSTSESCKLCKVPYPS
ncbi:FtsJ-like methyltransferase [Leishmania donovani]|uniref:FtsJ-like_methyltransferase_putative/Pfam:PF01728 n=1 Tax=Leishmania donovani TaxID=5661 RepID=A0A6J8FKJ0_LEIDO|nr:FtsJ-like methyltransferase [Leishmania donovani]VDZ47096.1 FtsJ-like_methyltransferase_putative/Pfam:PF01728 [Leishmania donovani]